MSAHPEHDGHEAVLRACDPDTGLKAIAALHRTRFGPAFDGCAADHATDLDHLAVLLAVSARHAGPSLIEMAAAPPFAHV